MESVWRDRFWTIREWVESVARHWIRVVLPLFRMIWFRGRRGEARIGGVQNVEELETFLGCAYNQIMVLQ